MTASRVVREGPGKEFCLLDLARVAEDRVKRYVEINFLSVCDSRRIREKFENFGERELFGL